MATNTEKADRVLTFGTVTLLIWDYLKKFRGTELGKKLEGRIISKAEEAAFGTVKEAEKTFDDEHLYDDARNEIQDPALRKEARDFEVKLRKKNPDQASSYVMFVADKVLKSGKDYEKTTTNGQDKTSTKGTDLSEGYQRGRRFIEELLSVKDPGNNPNKTFLARIAFLKGINAFSKIKKNDPGLVGKAVKAIGDDYKKGRPTIINHLDDLSKWANKKRS